MFITTPPPCFCVCVFAGVCVGVIGECGVFMSFKIQHDIKQ